MITLQNKNNNKVIQFAFNDTIHIVDDHMYIAEMPVVICSSRKDAERIQEEVGVFINELSKKLLSK